MKIIVKSHYIVDNALYISLLFSNKTKFMKTVVASQKKSFIASHFSITYVLLFFFVKCLVIYSLNMIHVHVCGARKCGTPASSILHRFFLPGTKLKVSLTCSQLDSTVGRDYHHIA